MYEDKTMVMHDHTNFELKTQFDLVEIGIRKCGGVSLFAQKIGVTRNTVARWKSGKHMMSGNYLMEIMRWIKEEKLTGNSQEMTVG
jgi:DNA-binding transcriptional regulator YiaG